MSYREYGPCQPLLIGYDPYRDVPANHLARLVDSVVEDSITIERIAVEAGQPGFDPRLLVKVLVYGYAMGVRSSRQLERLCSESLAYLFLTRGDGPSYRTICSARTELTAEIEQVWLSLLRIADKSGIKRLGRVVVDSTKIRSNSSPESVVTTAELEPLKKELERILEEARAVDAREDTEGGGGSQVKTPLKRCQMRDIIRDVRKALAAQKSGREPPTPASGVEISPKMEGRIDEALQAIEMATKTGLKHLCLTDPDARMMGEGRQKRIQECHSFEVAVDNGSIVAGQTTQSPTDNCRLVPIVEAAKLNEPEGIVSATADSGYFRAKDICALEDAGIATCVPDSQTAHDLHTGSPIGTERSRMFGNVPLSYVGDNDTFECPEGNVLKFNRLREKDGTSYREYRAIRSCRGCPLFTECIKSKNTNKKKINVGIHFVRTTAILARFEDDEQKGQYIDRSPAVETVFGFIRSVLNFTRWYLRGTEKVDKEAALLKAAVQMRRVHNARLVKPKSVPA